MKTKENPESSILRGKEVFQHEAQALKTAGGKLGKAFDKAVESVMACRGRIVVSGMGKHGIIARKIAATFASTGTPSFFLHPGEAAHGDLGMIDSADAILAVSNSGNTDEILRCLPFFSRNHNKLIAMTGNPKSELARQANVVLDISVEREVCPLNLAPMTSTTVAVVMGDALAVVLMEKRGFKAEDFALRHPSGTLGKRLLLKVGDLLKAGTNPVVAQSAPFEHAIREITASKLGAVSVVDAKGKLAGIITDGDLRRILQGAQQSANQTVASLLARPVRELMTKSPMHVTADTLAAKALSIMEDGPRKIFVLPVVDKNLKPVGMVHLHDLVGAGL